MSKSSLTSIGVIILSCIASVIVADSSRPLGDYTATLKHKPLPDFSNLDSTELLDYVISILTIAGPGLAIGILSIFVGIIYGLVRLCCCLCCSGDDGELDEEGLPTHKTYGFRKRMIPTIVYAIFMCWIFAGCIIGWTSNSKFTSGVTTLSDSVVDTGNGALTLGDTLINGLTGIRDSIPGRLDALVEQISGLPEIASRVSQLGVNVNGTSDDVSAISAKLKNINVNMTIIADLDAQLSAIDSQSSEIIGTVTDLTEQIADKLNTVLNETLSGIDDKIDDVMSGVDEIVSTSNEFVDSARGMANDINGYVDVVKGYDSQRGQGLAAVYAAGFAACCVAILGFFLKRPFPFHITAGFGFVFSFLFWTSGSVHLVLGIVLGDICPVADTVVRSFIPTEGQAAAAINGCLSDVSIFDSLELRNAFNLSDIFDYRAQFDEFTGFVDEFNFTAVDDYLGEIDELYAYNLTAASENVTAASFGWDQQNVYDALDGLNQQTEPYGHVFSLQNYTDIDLEDYPAGDVRDNINQTATGLGELITLNSTVYAQIDVVKAQFIDVQNDIDVLVGNIKVYQSEFASLQDNITTLSDVNVTNAINIIEGMVAQVNAFFDLGDCSFLGRNYRSILNSLCSMMKPAIDLLMGSQYMIGMGVIAVIVLVEVLAVRVPYPADDHLEYYEKDEQDYSSPNNNNGNQQPASISMAVREDSTPPDPQSPQRNGLFYT